MSWAWMDPKNQDSGEWAGFLEPGVTLEGKLETTGTFRIDSAAKGTIVSHETLILGEHASIEGEIVGKRVVIFGRFQGTIHAKERVEIQAAAVVTGQIHVRCLIIQPGAVFEGQCHVVESPDGSLPVAVPIRSAVIRASQ
jgi:cytoskeletal protein CcmA (bactofilin family)